MLSHSSVINFIKKVSDRYLGLGTYTGHITLRKVTVELDCKTADFELEKAAKSNPGLWVAHSRYVALACRNIALRCKDLSYDTAYI